MKTYLERFRKMVDMLQNHPKLEVLTFQTFEGLEESTLQEIEARLGYKLELAIREFFMQTNGLQLRWIFKDNEYYEADKHQFKSGPVAWNYSLLDYRPEDGVVMIWPLEKILFTNWEEQLYFEWMKGSEEQFMGKTYDLLDFSQSIRPFDLYSKYNDMAFVLNEEGNPPAIMGDDHQACYTDSLVTKFESYVEFVLANLGLVERRKDFYGIYAGHNKQLVTTGQSYWTEKNTVNIDSYLLKKTFPLANQMGAEMTNTNASLIHNMAKNRKPITVTQFNSMIEKHHDFLATGGAGGTWETLSVAGMVLGIYRGSKGEEGEQIGFERTHLPKRLDFQGAQIPFSNFCGCYCPNQNFVEADLSFSLFTDAMLEKTSFAKTNLQNTDFSRAFLQGSDFSFANLQGADFENCDLTGADFTGANLEGSRFPGAILKDVKR